MKFHHFFTCACMVALLLVPYKCIAECPAFPVRCYFMNESTGVVKLVEVKHTKVTENQIDVNVFSCSSLNSSGICDICRKKAPKILDTKLYSLYSIDYVAKLLSDYYRPGVFPSDAGKNGIWASALCSKK